MAYADIPPSMRPALSEFDPVSMIIGKDSGNLLQGAGGGGLGGGGGLAGIKAAQVEAVKRSILKSLGMLREIRQSLGKAHPAFIHARTNHLFSDLTLITSVPV